MKKTTLNRLFIIALALLVTSVCLGQDTKLTDAEEMQKRDTTVVTCDEYLNKFVGSWVAEYSENEKKVTTELTFKRAVNDQFLQGYWTTKDEAGKVVFEQLLVVTFNRGALQYLMYTFESTGWAKTFIGRSSSEKVFLQGMLPGGFEHYQWTVTPAGTLERAYWKPVQGSTKAEGDPDITLVFNPVKTK